MSEGRRGFLGRVGFGMSGQVFSRAILAAYTVIIVPLLIRAWGVNGYGQWIALTAMTSYMSLSNFGLVTTSANEMVIASGAGDDQRAKQTFQVSVNLSIYVVLPIIVALVVILCQFPWTAGLHLTQIDASAVRWIIALSGAALWFQTLRGLMVAVLYATGSYGFAYYVQGALKLCELGGVALAVSAFAGSQVSAAVIVAAAAFLELLIIAVYARRASPWARFDLRAMDRSWLARHAKPTVGFMVSNLATQGVMSQGPRVMLGALLGGQAVALYAVYATAMRFVDQLLLTLVLPLEIEIAHAAGRADFKKIYRLILAGTHISWAMFLVVAAGLLIFGPLIFHFWTTGRIEFSSPFMALYLGMSAANLQGRVSLHSLISTNRLYGVSFLTLAAAVASLGLGAALTQSMGIEGMVVGGITGEVINSFIVIAATATWLGKPVTGMLGDLLNFTATFSQLRMGSIRLLARLRQRS